MHTLNFMGLAPKKSIIVVILCSLLWGIAGCLRPDSNLRTIDGASHETIAPTPEDISTPSDVPQGPADDQETEDSYSNPFLGLGEVFDPNSPEARNDFTPAGEVKDQAVGSYNTGRLEKPSNLFSRQNSLGKEVPFQILYPGRKTFFATADMVGMIEFLAQSLRSIIPNSRLMIGDISMEKGGNLGSHKSHTIGMDADIAYLQPTVPTAFKSVLSSDLSKTILLKEQFQLFEMAVMTGKVDRIFVHPNIKDALCLTAKTITTGNKKTNSLALETLRRLIRDRNHANHFHLRLKCSKAQPRCQGEVDPPNSPGC